MAQRGKYGGNAQNAGMSGKHMFSTGLAGMVVRAVLTKKEDAKEHHKIIEIQ